MESFWNSNTIALQSAIGFSCMHTSKPFFVPRNRIKIESNFQLCSMNELFKLIPALTLSIWQTHFVCVISGYCLSLRHHWFPIFAIASAQFDRSIVFNLRVWQQIYSRLILRFSTHLDVQHSYISCPVQCEMHEFWLAFGWNVFPMNQIDMPTNIVQHSDCVLHCVHWVVHSI